MVSSNSSRTWSIVGLLSLAITRSCSQPCFMCTVSQFLERSPFGLHGNTARGQRLSRAWGSRIRPAHARALRHAWRAHARPVTAWRCPRSRCTPDRCAAPAWSSCTAKAMTHCSSCACSTSSHQLAPSLFISESCRPRSQQKKAFNGLASSPWLASLT